MPNPIRIPHWLTFTVNYATQSQTAANVFSFITTPDIVSILELQNVTGLFKDWILPALSAALSNTVLIVSVSGRTNYPVGPNFEVTIPYPTGTAGANMSDQEAENVAEVISWRTGQIGRSFRGRTFLPGVPETTVTGSIIGNAQLANIAAFGARVSDFLGSILTLTEFGVASRKLLIVSRIFTILVDLFTNSQRDRLPGHRRRDIH